MTTLPALERFIVSAPFGNYLLPSPAWTRTLGTFTLDARGGTLWRLWRVAKTLRYSRKLQSWRNQLGLPNPGIKGAPTEHAMRRFPTPPLLSIHGFHEHEWEWLMEEIERRYGGFSHLAGIELNISCPNIGQRTDPYDLKRVMVLHKQRLIVKLPPVGWQRYACVAMEAGVTAFHACNTLWTPAGGLSGAVLQPLSLDVITQLRRMFGDACTIIGGGGIRTLEDVKRFESAGATHFAVGSAWLNPLQHGQLAALPTRYLRSLNCVRR